MDNFTLLVNLISRRSPLQKKKISFMLASMNEAYFKDAERFATRYIEYLASEAISPDSAAESYVHMCNDMVRCQIRFMKTGYYPAADTDTCREVYQNMSKMKSYMVGLAVSQILWPTHYAIYKYFEEIIVDNRDDIGAYLEIGPGHGMFTDKALEHLQDDTKISIVEISAASLEITKSIIAFFRPQDSGKITYYHMDILEANFDRKYDFIMMGEVLEHSLFPEKILEKTKTLLSERGRAFISTCIDCPAIDHVYHFRSIKDIHGMFADAGLKVVQELILPVENLPLEEICRKKITINYCAVVQEERYDKV